MKIASLTAHSLDIPFRAAFRHASAERDATHTLWVYAVSTHRWVGYGESCPREYATGESLASAAAFFRRHEVDWVNAIDGVPALTAWAAAHADEIDRNPAAWCAVELALLDLIGRDEGKSVESLLGLPETTGRFRYTAVLGDADAQSFAAHLKLYHMAGFSEFKVQLSTDVERDRAKVRALEEAGVAPHAVRADANNLWPDADAGVAHLAALGYRFSAIEEPLRAGDCAGMAQLAAALDTRIVLDESFFGRGQLDSLPDGPWVANLRVSDMGGLVRSLALLPELRRRGIALIVGAHVGETSVLTRAALAVAAAGRDLLIGQEGAFGTHLLARDVADPPLLFGAGGVLEIAPGMFARPGFGLAAYVADAYLKALASK